MWLELWLYGDFLWWKFEWGCCDDDDDDDSNVMGLFKK